MRRRLAATLSAAISLTTAGAVALTSSAALAGPPAPEASKPDKPWGRGVFTVGGGLGGTFYGDSGGSLSFGVGAEYFVWHGIGLGLNYTNLFVFLSNSIKNDFPGIEDRVPTYYGFLSPTLRVFLFRSFRFSPYVVGGTGPVFLNNGQPTLGRWEAGGGFYIGLGPRAALDIGVGVSQLYTRSACRRATTEVFTAAELGTTGDVRVETGNCGIGVFPRIGIVFGFGGSSGDDKKSRRERRRDKEMEGFEPPEATPDEGGAAPEYAPAPENEPAPTPVEDSPGYAAPESSPESGAPVEGEAAPVAEDPVADGVEDSAALPPAPEGEGPPAGTPTEEPGDPSAPPVQSPSSLPGAEPG